MQLSEHSFVSWDGAVLFYRAWIPQGGVARKAVLLFHRGHEHSGRWGTTVAGLGMEDAAFFAWDQRGHGKSPGERGGAPGLSAVIRDADCFARHVGAAHGMKMEQTAVVAASVGAVIAAAWVHDYAPRVCGLVLAAPALRVKLYVPLAVAFLRMREKLRPGGKVASYVKARMLTHDAQQAAAYEADDLIFRQIAVNVLLDLHDAGTRLVDDAGAIVMPTLVMAAGKDWVVKTGAQRAFFKRLGAGVKQMEFFEGFYHSLFHEKESGRVVERVRGFLEDCFAREPSGEGLLNADKGGPTRTEFDLLRGPGALRWRLMRAMMKLHGLFSEGIALGWKSGFDSGVSLDYVYENKARGRWLVGKLIDRVYLNAIGWRGIRARRENLEQLLAETMERVWAAGAAAHVLDIAAGAGRYVLETVKRLEAKAPQPTLVTLRDYQECNLEAARKLAAQLKVGNATIEKGDAFDRKSLAEAGMKGPRPTIAIASGIYELIPENEPVRRSLAGIAEALEERGYLLYTCQPWHPQVELIARTLVNREGKPWVMRRRTQAEMDALVRAAGFEKLEQRIDRWGIFTVSVAQRVRR